MGLKNPAPEVRFLLEAQRIMNVKERFWKKVNKTETCWLWTAATRAGYGAFKIGKKIEGAHRVAYKLFNGDIGDKLVCHSCDNKLCVNPEHLFIGTYSDNLNDSYDKGRKIWNYGKKIRHGTESRYSHHACRCDKCKYAHKIYRREQRKNKHTIPEKNNGSSRGS